MNLKKLFLLTLLVTVLAAFGAATAQAGNKVQICHIPPGNPANFHTITVSEKALPAHLAHGDLPGDCFANCAALCDDGNACTIDACDEETETCFGDHPPVDCDDGNLCTSDSCDPANGCQAAPIVCDDGDACTVDACNPFDGQCTGTPIDCGPLGACLPASGQCDFPCDGITCEPVEQCREVGECVLPGECIDGAPVADGSPCDDGDAGTSNDQCTAGACQGTPEETPITEVGTPTCTGSYLVDESWYAPGFNIGGTHYDHGIYTHPPSASAPASCTWNLDGSFGTLSALVGLEDGDGNCGNGVQFYVVADGVEVWRSPTVLSYDPALAFSTSINNAMVLKLNVDPLGHYFCDEAVWVDPTLTP